MKKIIINGRFLLHRTTGVERYAREILQELDKNSEGIQYILAIPPEVKELPHYKQIQVQKIGKLKNRLWEHFSLPLFALKQRASTLNLCNVAPLFAPGIVCLHDMKIMATPQYFSKKFILWYNILFRNAAKRAKKIITVSEFSKNEILKYMKVPEEKIVVIPDAWQHYKATGYDENTHSKYGLQPQGYFFSMCSLEPNKNFKWIAEVARKNPESLFAVSGSINKTVFAEGLGFDCPSNMRLLGYVSDEEAKTLMRDCRAFLFPTFYEGFGIPPLEAISAGARCVVVSDSEVMHELFESAVNFINPNQYDVNLERLTSMSENTAELILQKYSWENSAKVLHDVLREL